jgi:hypothetical protein
MSRDDTLSPQPVLLGLLMPQPRHGYELYQELSRGLGRVWRIGFLDWLEQPTGYLRHIRVEFLARLYFFQAQSLPGLEQLVAEQKAICSDQMERFSRLAAETDDEFRQLVLEFRRGQLEAVIGWLDRCVEILNRS